MVESQARVFSRSALINDKTYSNMSAEENAYFDIAAAWTFLLSDYWYDTAREIGNHCGTKLKLVAWPTIANLID